MGFKTLSKTQYKLLKRSREEQLESTKKDSKDLASKPISFRKMNKKKNTVRSSAEEQSHIMSNPKKKRRNFSLQRLNSFKNSKRPSKNVAIPHRSLTPNLVSKKNKAILDKSLFEILENENNCSFSNSDQLPQDIIESIDEGAKPSLVLNFNKRQGRRRRSLVKKTSNSPNKKYQIFKKMVKSKRNDSESSSLAEMFKKQRQKFKFKRGAPGSSNRSSKSQRRRRSSVNLKNKNSILFKKKNTGRRRSSQLFTHGPKFLLTDSDSISQCGFVSAKKGKKRRPLELRDSQFRGSGIEQSVFKIEEIIKGKKILSERVRRDDSKSTFRLQNFVMRKNERFGRLVFKSGEGSEKPE